MGREGKGMNGRPGRKALVAFGTKCGTTSKVAEEIAVVLRKKGIETTVLDLRDSERCAVDDFDLVVVGSSIIMDKWSKGALEFLERNREALSSKKVAMFVCSGNRYTSPEKADQYRKAYLDDVAARFGIGGSVPKGLFGGDVDFGRYGFLTRAVISSMMREKLNEIDYSKPYDFRDWNAIRAWASSLEAV
ncbi:MAG TPA: flavodoxin domain-containing protein [Thermoplasmata archaeon]|jgi:menaquinone-dependent protoporphyrinogen oxidase